MIANKYRGAFDKAPMDRKTQAYIRELFGTEISASNEAARQLRFENSRRFVRWMTNGSSVGATGNRP